MPTCVAVGCKNRFSNKIKGITFHRFPKNIEIKQAWIHAIGRENWKPTIHSVVCSEHFEESDFNRIPGHKTYLKQNAVPSVFKTYPKYLQKVKKKRKPPVQRNEDTVGMKAKFKDPASIAHQMPACTSPIVCPNPPVQKTTVMDVKPTVPGSILENRLLCQTVSPTYAQNQLPSCSIVSPTKAEIKRKLEQTESIVHKYRTKIKSLQQAKRRHLKQIRGMKSLLKDLINKNIITEEHLEILYAETAHNKELLSQQLSKAQGETKPLNEALMETEMRYVYRCNARHYSSL